MRIFAVLVLMITIASAKAQPSVDIIEYISRYKALAIEEMQRTGIPASIKLAQGIHETYAGKSVLVLKSNNHFGIKCKAYWTGKKVYHDDDSRGECFRSYDSAVLSYRDHSNFLRGSERYNFLFELDPTDYKSWAFGLKKAGYATNPKYAPIIIKLIEDYDLQQYSLIALGKMLPSEEVAANTEKPEATVPMQDSIAEPAPQQPSEPPPVPAITYPSGEFTINNTRVIYSRQGTSLLSVAQEFDIPLRRLLDFNDMKGEDVLVKDQLVYLQRKRRTGNNEFHTVADGESLHDICQLEAIRLDNLLQYNHLQNYMMPVVGEKLYLQAKSPSRPKL